MSEIGKTAVWAITFGGLEIGQKLLKSLSSASILFVSDTISRSITNFDDTVVFDKLSAMFAKQFKNYDAHICIFSTGIAVRIAAPLVQSKISDPAVVVVDDRGFHAISLLSGHLGGANELTLEVARIIGASPVITTATDINKLPSIDMVAKSQNLVIENPDMIKKVNMAFLQGERIRFIDPFNLVKPHIPRQFILNQSTQGEEFGNDVKLAQESESDQEIRSDQDAQTITVFCDDTAKYEKRVGQDKVSRETKKLLLLRPPSLVAGMGCNRGTSKAELMELLISAFKEHNLSVKSLAAVATTALKQDETGLLELADELGKPIKFYSKDELNSVETIENPSDMVEKHIGVKSVCEAAAILAAQNGHLIVPKIKKGNATIAVARIIVQHLR
ncbi:MAG: cobalt-precorrin 5A hydrolase [Desulfamplus sp.]|nr:cobalt-precorrin 5A hydrolase [Desulfamplus sp.]